MYGIIQFAPLPTRYRGVSILIVTRIRPAIKAAKTAADAAEDSARALRIQADCLNKLATDSD